MTFVVDSSIVVAALIDTGSEGRWAERVLQCNQIVAPTLLQVECTNVLRRLTASGRVIDLEASMAQKDLMLLPISLFPFEPFADRVWALRHNLCSYDAWYVAIAETVKFPLATMDTRLINAPGPTCEFLCAADDPSLATQ